VAKLDLYVPHRRRVVIYGQVQGIGFRLWLRNVANTLALVGSCRLLEDGTCEAIVQGDKTLLKQFVVACKRGPHRRRRRPDRDIHASRGPDNRPFRGRKIKAT